MTDAQLLSFFYRGLIPAPLESEEDFYLRTERSPPLDNNPWEEVFQKTPHHFGWAIDWMPVLYSNKGLRLWEGGATWSGKNPYIQLKTKLQNSSYWGYNRIEILVHEAIHAARIQFSEPQFEEILASSTANRWWRRFFGPIFTYTWEPFVLLLCCIASTLSYYIPICVLIILIGWLQWRHQKYNKCRKGLPLSIIICLTDKEIRNYRKNSFENYLKTTPKTPRIRLLYLLLKKEGEKKCHTSL
jgi:hypothetical protein